MQHLMPVDPDIPLLEKVVYSKDQPQYIPLPACRTSDGEVVTKWKLTFLMRIKVLFSGSFYLTLLTFNKPLTPVRLSIDKPVYIES